MTLRTVMLIVATAITSACTSIGDLPPVDLSAPGWSTWSGQASWRREAEAAPLAGDLLAGLAEDGDVFVGFSKAALPVFTAFTSDGKWQIEFVERGRSFSGRGDPRPGYGQSALS